MCENRGGRPGLPDPNRLYGFCGHKATLNSNSPMTELGSCVSESRGGRPGLPVPNIPLTIRLGRKSALNLNSTTPDRTSLAAHDASAVELICRNETQLL